MSVAEKKSVLIIGKNGQVGRELVERVDQLTEFYVVALDSKELDIENTLLVEKVLMQVAPDVVVNAAAYTAVDKAEEDVERAFAVNCKGVENLARACKLLSAPLIHLSTDYVFDGTKREDYVETDEPCPSSAYGQSKLAGENILREILDEHLILRVSWVFGQWGSNFVKTMLRLAEQKDELNVVADQYGAPTAASDIAKTIIRFLKMPVLPRGTFHLESSPGVVWSEFAEEIFEQSRALGFMNNPPSVNAITSEQYVTPVKRPANSKLRCTTPALCPVVDWKAALTEMLLSTKDNRELL